MSTTDDPQARIAELEAEAESAARMLANAMDGWTAEATPLHHQLARIALAAWNPHVSAEECREAVRAVVGHPLMPREDVAALAVSLRAEMARLGLPVPDSAEEKVARVREFAASDALQPWARQRLADALDPPPPPCARCHGRGKIPDWSHGLDPVYGEPAGKPCPDCTAEESAT